MQEQKNSGEAERANLHSSLFIQRNCKLVLSASSILLFLHNWKAASSHGVGMTPLSFGFEGLWASFSCPSVTSCLLSFVASFVVFDFLGVSLKLTGF